MMIMHTWLRILSWTRPQVFCMPFIFRYALQSLETSCDFCVFKPVLAVTGNKSSEGSLENHSKPVSDKTNLKTK